MSKKYDFETILSRKGQGSYKWEQMYEVLPELEDDIVPFSVADMELMRPFWGIRGLIRNIMRLL